MKTNEFDYILPETLIAQTPSDKRENSRLMYVNKNSESITHHTFSDITDMLTNDCVLVLNNTKVFKARLLGKKKTGASIEILLLNQLTQSRWQCLAKPLKKLNIGDQLIFSNNLSAIVKEKTKFAILEFNISNDFFSYLNKTGNLPLPPYIFTENPNQYEDRYQTVFAKHNGSVAAPTAGLHFTTPLLKTLSIKNIPIEYITLHVGYGTFKPISAEHINDHKMHYETYTIENSVLSRIQEYKNKGKKIIAVGTTTARTLEAAFKSPNTPLSGTHQTNIFISPGYKFNCINGLITNFHLPKSSLLVMISAFLGLTLTKKAYKEAIIQKYKFYSFGDAMLIL